MTPLTRIRLATAAALVSVGALALAAQAPPQPPPGGVLITGTSEAMPGTDLQPGRRRFEAGARSYWHSHEKGQLLLVEDGRMRLQRRGEAMRELGAGQSDYTGPNVVHWHGATPRSHGVLVNLNFGGGTTWMEPVTDAQYEGR